MTETEAVVIGAGPAGLFQVFQLGLLGLHAELLDALPHAGGQVIELYGDKPIYDIPALPVCTGRELIDRLLQQVAPLRPGLHFGQSVDTLQPQPDGRFVIGTAQGLQFLARTVFIAAGVGAFEPRRLKVPGLEAHEGRQVFHRRQDPAAFAGQRLLIVGGDELALEHALACAMAQPVGQPVTLLHRRRVFQAPDALIARFDALCEQGRLRFVAGQITGIDTGPEGRLHAVRILDPQATEITLPLDAMQVLLGLSPKLGPVAHWGLALERKQLVVDAATFSTTLPGVYAIGDIVHYPGKKRLIVCGFHEATMAAHAAAAWRHPEQAGPLLYTSSSTLLQQRLGVGSAAEGKIAP